MIKEFKALQEMGVFELVKREDLSQRELKVQKPNGFIKSSKMKTGPYPNINRGLSPKDFY